MFNTILKMAKLAKTQDVGINLIYNKMRNRAGVRCKGLKDIMITFSD